MSSVLCKCFNGNFLWEISEEKASNFNFNLALALASFDWIDLWTIGPSNRFGLDWVGLVFAFDIVLRLSSYAWIHFSWRGTEMD